MPEVTRDTRIPSMLASFRFVASKARSKLPPLMLSKKLAGKSTNSALPYQAYQNLVPLLVSIRGKLVRLLSSQAVLKLVPLPLSIRGKLVSLLSRQADPKLVPLLVSIRGKLVRLLPSQAYPKLVPLLVSIEGSLLGYFYTKLHRN